MSLTKQYIRFFVLRPLWTGLAIFWGLLMISAFFIQNESKQIIAEQKVKSLSQIGVYSARIERDINSVLAVLKALKAEIAIDEDLSEKHFPWFARELLADSELLSHFNLAPELTIQFLFPIEGKEDLIGLNYYDYPDQMPLIRKALLHRTLVVSAPQALKNGSEAILARFPVFLDSDYGEYPWGIISTLVNHKDLFKDVLAENNNGQFKIAIGELEASGNPASPFLGSATVLTMEPVVDTIELPAQQWFLAATPVGGWSVPTSRLWLMWGLSTLLSAFSAGAAFLLARVYNDKTKAIDTANYRANYDVLTGLPNRYYFSQRLNTLIREAKREEQDFAVFFIDIDHFKQINDSAGHSIGDQLLIEFASRLKLSSRDSDIVARLAGDEFVMVLRNVDDVIQADLLAEKVQQCINQPFVMNSRHYSVSASMGIAMYPIDGDDVTNLLLHADHAMYAAKRAGRNGYFFFNEGMQDEAAYFLVVHNDILRGIEEKQFVLHYQPVLCLRSGEIVKCEALIRWNHPDKGFILPDDFIPIAERTGAIRELGNWVLRQACKDLREFLDKGIDIQLSVNRSVSEFYSARAYESWKTIMNENGVDSRRFIFEITESLFMDKSANCVNLVSVLRKMGIEFAIDDFGTGYSAINYLRNYPVNYLKIDKSFIQDLLHDEQDKTLVEVIVKMGIALNIRVIAEGVENDGQVEVLRSFGCEYIQGFWLSQPLPLTEVLAFFEDSKNNVNLSHGLDAPGDKD